MMRQCESTPLAAGTTDEPVDPQCEQVICDKRGVEIKEGMFAVMSDLCPIFSLCFPRAFSADCPVMNLTNASPVDLSQ